jgi:hypothetical protein
MMLLDIRLFYIISVEDNQPEPQGNVKLFIFVVVDEIEEA